jgi:predicted MPP superfamily phosphohydrolase
VPANVIYNYNTIQIRSVNFTKRDTPKELNNFKLVFISDIHADQFTDSKRLQKYISDVNKLHPDLVLVGGDLISSSPNYIQTAAKYMGEIKSKYGVYSCVGDHDNWAYRNNSRRSLAEVENALNQQKVEMIDNSDKVLNVDSAKIDVVFITNTYVEHIKKSTLDKLTDDTTKYGLKILLTHQPRNNVVARAAMTGFDLLLAGHTHGGQITFLFPFLNLTPTLLETKYVRGDFIIGKMLMVVTRGLGMSLVPMRYNSEPEITIINIRKN